MFYWSRRAIDGGLSEWGATKQELSKWFRNKEAEWWITVI